jgi:LysM repeat protein
MKRYLLLLLTVVSFFPARSQSLSYAERAAAYIAQYKDWAIAEQQRSGVPAAITLAQGVHETSAGASELAANANNHFGIKCKKEWTGETYAYTDDAPDECFRKYKSALESYRDHSDYLRSGKRYARCFALDARDYAGWAHELKKCGYATNPAYAQKLIKIIEDFHLQDYTIAALNPSRSEPTLIASAASPVAAVMMAEKGAEASDKDADTPAQEEHEYGKLTKKEGVRGFWARQGDVLLEYAIQYKLRYAKLLEMNGLPDAPLAKDQFIYIERGGTFDRVMAKDVSAPAVPAPVAAVAPTSAPEQSPVASVAAAPAAEKPAPVPTQQTPAAAAPTHVMSAAEATAAAEARIFGDAALAAKPAGQVAAAPVADAEDVDDAPAGQPEKPFNIANEKTVEEQPAEPQDEFSRLKARLDKVVYAQPAKPVAPVPAASNAVTASAAASQFHTVKAGETAFGIAKQYGITMQQLMELNKLGFGSDIKAGQKLRVK